MIMSNACPNDCPVCGMSGHHLTQLAEWPEATGRESMSCAPGYRNRSAAAAQSWRGGSHRAAGRGTSYRVGRVLPGKVAEMTATQLITIASVAAVVVSALAIAAGLKSVRDQLRVTVFLTYTDRYARIMSGIPFEARQPGGSYRLASRPEDERIRVLGAFREYFNLCSEEKWLYEHRKIDRATWDMWVSSMQIVAQFPCFPEAWQALGFEYDCYNEFQDFVDKKLLPHSVASGQGAHTQAIPDAGAAAPAASADSSADR
jgi:hypothetical protein